MTKEENPSRLPKANVVQGNLPVLDENNPDALFISPNKYLKVKGGSLSSGFDNYLTGISGLGGAGTTLNSTLALSNNIIPIVPVKEDTVDLTDIESITYEQYYDSVSNLIKYKAIIKIRNASINKTNVQGVDARIYNPNA
jgi:hypothetical protein